MTAIQSPYGALSRSAVVAAATYTGSASAQSIAAGPAVTPYAGMTWAYDLWGTVTTTVQTQTLKFQVRYGGATIIVDSGPIAPNSGATVTGADIRVTGTLQFTSTVLATAEQETDLNFFPSSINEGTAAISGSGLFEVLMTASAAAVSVTIDGGYWAQIR